MANKISAGDLRGLRTLEKLIVSEKLKEVVVKRNTVAVPNAQAWLNQQAAIITLLEAERGQIIQDIAHGFGLQGPVAVDLENGKIWQKD